MYALLIALHAIIMVVDTQLGLTYDNSIRNCNLWLVWLGR